jgi:hypothetical protein
MAENNVYDINEARMTDNPNDQLVADGTDLAIAQKPQLPALSTEAHIVDLLVTGGMGAAVGYLAQPSMQGVAIGALAGTAFGLVEKAVLGHNAGVRQDHRVFYAVAALGSTIGAGYLSYRWR